MAQHRLAFHADDDLLPSISPFQELGAYEVLWAERGASVARLAARFEENLDTLPSDLVPHDEAVEMARTVSRMLKEAGVEQWGVRIHRAGEYPLKLRDAKHPVELLYYAGTWELVESRCIAVVGTRKPTAEGVARARKMVQHLVRDGWTIVSGLARGIDTVAHTAALEMGGRTIAVIGTPLTECYPPENADLQRELMERQLVISQVPVYRHSQGNPRSNRHFFPERNITMSALAEGTVIIEAGNTSGTLTQARAALYQKRKLFILDSCFRNPDLTWPQRFAEDAVRVAEYSDISDALPAAPTADRREDAD